MDGGSPGRCPGLAWIAPLGLGGVSFSMWINRTIEAEILVLAAKRPVVVLSGTRLRHFCPSICGIGGICGWMNWRF